jgi:hypothetical protein
MNKKIDMVMELQAVPSSPNEFTDALKYSKSLSSPTTRMDLVIQANLLLDVATDLKLLSLLILLAPKRCDLSLRNDATGQPIFLGLEAACHIFSFDKADQQIDHIKLRSLLGGSATLFLAGQRL